METYATARGWNENKMAAMAATVQAGDPKHWPEFKRAILVEYQTDPESCERPFLARKRQPGKSFLVYFAVLELLIFKFVQGKS